VRIGTSSEPRPCLTVAWLLAPVMPARDFSAVYDEHVWQVYGFFAYRMRSRADAEDLTQLTFERALRAWSRYDPRRATVATWLLTIARNLLIDHLRADRSSRRQPLDALDAGHDALVAPDVQPDLGLEPDLERALSSLGAREREIIALRFGGELTGPEIAELMGLSLANVQQILSRSLRRMRSVIDERQSATSSKLARPGSESS
jgi:RNA polymerase sigma factor (sigma-70 family)